MFIGINLFFTTKTFFENTEALFVKSSKDIYSKNLSKKVNLAEAKR